MKARSEKIEVKPSRPVGREWDDLATDDLRYKTLRDFARILALFEANDGEDRGVADISRTLQMLPSKVSRMLKTLEADGLFERNPDTGRYRVGARFLQAGLLYVMNHPLRRIILPHLEQTAREQQLLAGWGIFKNGRVVVVDRLRVGEDSTMHILGSDIPLHSTAYGKLFLAYMPEKELESALKLLTFARFTAATITDESSMRTELDLVKKRGCAIDDGETREGLVGLAAPVFDAREDLVAAFTVAGRKSVITTERLSELTSYLTVKALFISRQLGYMARF